MTFVTSKTSGSIHKMLGLTFPEKLQRFLVPIHKKEQVKVLKADLERLDHLSKISRLTKDVVLMTSHAFTSEHGRETQTLSNLFFGNPFIAAFCFTNNEFAHLRWP